LLISFENGARHVSSLLPLRFASASAQLAAAAKQFCVRKQIVDSARQRSTQPRRSSSAYGKGPLRTFTAPAPISRIRRGGESSDLDT
jgi:hypothetical protein